MTFDEAQDLVTDEMLDAAQAVVDDVFRVDAMRIIAAALKVLDRTEEGEPERFFAFEFEVWQGDEMVASASGPREHALREAMHYATQYEQDGPVRVFEVTRTLVRPNEPSSPAAGGSPRGARC